MLQFSKVQALRVPEGTVSSIRAGGKKLWSAIKYRYVSLGDSIAAGHAISSNWETDYGTKSQYGINGNTSTVIVPGCYTDLIRTRLMDSYDRISVASFARSGERVYGLIPKLSDTPVQNAVKRANLVTICIGANDILGPALENIENYINKGAPVLEGTGSIGEMVTKNLRILADDENERSYFKLFTTLRDINPDATYVFTTIYNPYKYLWLDDGPNGFFSSIFNVIPQITINIPLVGTYELDDYLKQYLLNTSAIRTLYDRVNMVGDWAEGYIIKLNNLLRTKINEFNNAHGTNFLLADTKAIYDSIPDRPEASAAYHYENLVSVEFTRGFAVGEANWGALWADSDAWTYWQDMGSRLISSGIEAMAGKLAEDTVSRVIVPDIDPHPEHYGHYALEQSFADALGWAELPRNTIAFNKGTHGSGTMDSRIITMLDPNAVPTVGALNGKTNNSGGYTIIKNTFTPGVEGYYFSNWISSSGASYSNMAAICVSSDLTLTAQWSNLYVVNFYKALSSYAKNVYTGLDRPYEGETGIQEIYGCNISTDGGSSYTVLDTSKYRGNFSSSGNDKLVGSVTYPYGTRLQVWVTYTTGDKLPVVGTSKYKETTSHIYLNGGSPHVGYSPSAVITLSSDTNICFEWVLSGTVYVDATANWNCWIATKSNVALQ